MRPLLAATLLAVAPTLLLLLASVAALWPAGRSRLVPFFVGLAWVDALASVSLGVAGWGTLAQVDATLFTWSPMGLYGAAFVVQIEPESLLLALPPLTLAVAGAIASTRRRSTRQATGEAGARRAAGDALSLVGLAGAIWALVAGDLVSLYLGMATFLVAGTGLVWLLAGAAAAGRRLFVVAVALAAFLTAVLLLGKVNGHFHIRDLSAIGYGAPVFLGLVLAAAAMALVPPLHHWALASARARWSPALAVAGACVALDLLLLANRLAGDQPVGVWRPALLAAIGWWTVLACAGVAITRRAPPVRLAALAVGRAGLFFLASAVGTAPALAAAVLYTLSLLILLGLMWLLSALHRAPHGSPVRPAGSSRGRTPAFWATSLLVASAAGLPGTVGGLAKGALVGAFAGGPGGSQLLRLAPLALDAAVLVVGGTLLWHGRHLAWPTGVTGWVAFVVAALATSGPVAAPNLLIGRWFGPAAAVALGTGGAPLTLEVSRQPSLFSWILGLMALWVLVQRLRGREWLPRGGRVLLAALTLAWSAMRQRWRIEVLGRGGGARLVPPWPAIGRGLQWSYGILRPLEERYYAAAAVLLAVALIYALGR